MSETDGFSVAIIGAGISGLASAFNILRTARRVGKEVKVVLYDRNPTPGGTWSSSSVYDGLITNNSWTQMLLDDDGAAEAMFRGDPSLGAGPGGFRATGEGMIHVMEHAARQVTSLGAELRTLCNITSATQPSGPGSGWDITAATLPSPSTPNTPSTPAFKSDTSTDHYDKLIIATGSFSDAAVPSFARPFLLPPRATLAQDAFELDDDTPFVIHTSHLSEPVVQRALMGKKRKVIVVGASKSALDASERLALHDYDVTLVLRNPPYLAPPAAKHPKTGEPADAAGAVGTRLKTSTIPYFPDPVHTSSTSSWSSFLFSNPAYYYTGGPISSLFRYVLHSTFLGSFMHKRLSGAATKVFESWGGWTSIGSKMADMRPRVDLMWSESSLFPGPSSFPALVQSGKLKLVKGTVVDMTQTSTSSSTTSSTSASPYTLTIDSPAKSEPLSLTADIVIFGTGWRTGSYPFLSRSLVEELGLPFTYQVGIDSDGIPEREKNFARLDDESLEALLRDQRTLREIPEVWKRPGYAAREAGKDNVVMSVLADGTANGEGKVREEVAPYRLYRLMVPTSHLEARDVVVAGVPTCKANHVLFLVQAHWIADYFFSLLPTPLPSSETANKEISMHAVWSRRLFGPANGKLGQWLGALWIEHCGRLCRDMGVTDDGQGLTGVVTSGSYRLEEKRRLRDERRRW